MNWCVYVAEKRGWLVGRWIYQKVCFSKGKGVLSHIWIFLGRGCSFIVGVCICDGDLGSGFRLFISTEIGRWVGFVVLLLLLLLYV